MSTSVKTPSKLILPLLIFKNVIHILMYFDQTCPPLLFQIPCYSPQNFSSQLHMPTPSPSPTSLSSCLLPLRPNLFCSFTYSFRHLDFFCRCWAKCPQLTLGFLPWLETEHLLCLLSALLTPLSRSTHPHALLMVWLCFQSLTPALSGFLQHKIKIGGFSIRDVFTKNCPQVCSSLLSLEYFAYVKAIVLC